MKSKKNVLAFTLGVLIALIGIGGYFAYNHFVSPKLNVVFEGADKVSNGKTEVIQINKSLERTSFTHIATIRNTSDQDMIIKSIDVENLNELQPYINTLTLTVGNTSLIAKDLTERETINLPIPASNNITVMVEYSLKNLDDDCPDTIDLSIKTK